MQTTNATYKAIVAGRYSVEYKAVIDGVTYDQSQIVNGGYPVITYGLFEDFSVGNAVAAQLDIWLVPQGTIPTMALIEIYFRVKNATQTSDWYPKGKFFIDTRATTHEGLIHITAYDAMLKTEYVFMTSGTWTETTAKATVQMVASDIGVSIEAETLNILDDGITIPSVPVIGEDGTTGRDMLRGIAALYGGNFIIDEAGALKLVLSSRAANLYNTAENPIEQGAIASENGQDTTSSTRVRSNGYVAVTPSLQYSLSCSLGRVFVLQYDRHKNYLNLSSGWQTSGYTFTAGSGTYYVRFVFSINDSTAVTPASVKWVQFQSKSKTPYEPYVAMIGVGVQMETFDSAPTFDGIDRVILRATYDEKTGFRSPDVSDATWNAMTGRILEAETPWTTQAYADNLLSRVKAYAYRPYEATGVNVDPAIQLGDRITLNGITSRVCKEIITLDMRCAADISAPYDEEINHEYPYRSPAERVPENAVSEEQLAIAGATIINGSNIKSGTITLGGNNNGRGQMVLLDENDVEFGRWDNDRLLIKDDTASENYVNTSKFAVIRQGDDPDTQYGAFIGTMQLYNVFFPDTYPNECEPFLYIKGSYDTTDPSRTLGGVLIYPNNINIFDGAGKSTIISADDETLSNIISRTSGLGIQSQASYRWGRVVQISLSLNGDGNWHNVGDNIFVGQVASGYLPKGNIMGVGYYSTGVYIGWIDTTGKITIRLTGYANGYTFTSGSPLVISWTYLI